MRVDATCAAFDGSFCRRRSISALDSPASTSTRVPPASMYATLPDEPLPSRENRIGSGTYSKRGRPGRLGRISACRSDRRSSGSRRTGRPPGRAARRPRSSATPWRLRCAMPPFCAPEAHPLGDVAAHVVGARGRAAAGEGAAGAGAPLEPLVLQRVASNAWPYGIAGAALAAAGALPLALAAQPLAARGADAAGVGEADVGARDGVAARIFVDVDAERVAARRRRGGRRADRRPGAAAASAAARDASTTGGCAPDAGVGVRRLLLAQRFGLHVELVGEALLLARARASSRCSVR